MLTVNVPKAAVFFSSRRRHTSSLCDWSSDVCSSDLRQAARENTTVVVQCPTCQSKFRIADEKVTDRGVRVRCTSCKNVFQVKKPGAAGPDSGPGTTIDPSALGASAVAKAAAGSRPTTDPLRKGAARPTTDPLRNVPARPTTDPLRNVPARPTTDPLRKAAARPTTDPLRKAAARPTTDPLRKAAARPTTDPLRKAAARPTTDPLRKAAGAAQQRDNGGAGPW